MEIPRAGLALLAILAPALALRLALAVLLRPVPVSDFKIYWDIAVGLAEGRGYVIGTTPSAFRPIGYPLLLSLVIRLFGADWWYAVLVQVVTSTAVVAATYWLSARLFGVRAGLAAAALTAVMPDHLLWSTVLNSEIPAMLWTLLGVTLWIPPRPGPVPDGARPSPAPWPTGMDTRSRWLPSPGALLASGILLGLAALTRPVMLPAPVLFFLYAGLLSRYGAGGGRARRRWRSVVAGTALLVLGMALVVGPWTVRNYVALGALVPVSTNGGVNLWQGNNPHATGGFYWSEDPEINPLLKVTDEVEQDRLGRRLALQWIREHPWDFIRLGLIKWGWLLTDVRTGPFFSIREASRPVPTLVEQAAVPVLKAGLYSLLALTVWGIRVWWVRSRAGTRQERGEAARASVPVLFLLFMLALHVVFPAWDRFRFPFTPFMLALAGLAVDEAVRRWWKRRWVVLANR